MKFRVVVSSKVMGFRFTLIRVDNLEYLRGFVLQYLHLDVANFACEKLVVLVVLIVEVSGKVQKNLVKKYHLVD